MTAGGGGSITTAGAVVNPPPEGGGERACAAAAHQSNGGYEDVSRTAVANRDAGYRTVSEGGHRSGGSLRLCSEAAGQGERQDDPPERPA